MKTNTLDRNLSSSALHLTAIICLVAVFSVSTFVPVQAADSTGEDLLIIKIIHEGPHETVLIANLTREKIDLCKYLLKAEKAGLTFDFAEEADCKATIAPLSVIRVHSGSGSSNYYASWNDIPWSQKEIWEDESDKATLVDPDGNVVSTYSYGTDYE
ncbi:MAG: lamin tail domain-containing protein [Candidatus Bipolaricaulota bacterium]|nr:lamin tail domain-containing protein [Candidatus Bipolaricaulota bacterium]